MPASDALFKALFLSLGRLNFTPFFFGVPPFFSPCPPARLANGSRKNLPAAVLAALFVPHAPDEKILTNRTKESIIKHILCGYVGTGRQDGLRIRWETVQVRALLSAPRKNRDIDASASVSRLFFFRSIFSRPVRKFFNCAAKEMCRSFTDNLFDIKAHFTLKSLFL